MSSYLVRAHPAMSVRQLKLSLQEQAEEEQLESARSITSNSTDGTQRATAATAEHMPLIHNIDALALQLDGQPGSLDNTRTLSEYGLTAAAAAAGYNPTLVAFFIALPDNGDDDDDDALHSARSSLSDGGDGSFDFGSVLGDELLSLRVVFANTPESAVRVPIAAQKDEGEEAKEQEEETAAAAEDHTSSPLLAALSSRSDSRRSSARSNSGVPPLPAVPGVSGDASAPTSRPSSSSAEGAAAAAEDVPHTTSSRVPHEAADEGGDPRPVTSGDTARKFLEDDGDIASQTSDGDQQQQQQQQLPDFIDAADLAAQQPQPQHGDDDNAHAEDHLSPDVHDTTHHLSASHSAPRLVKGALLDGYRLLRECGVDLPEEVTRAVVAGGGGGGSGASKLPLVDAVPEHLAEFVNLSFLDLSGQNVPLDRLRLMPQLESLVLAANAIRGVEFAPIPGIHFDAVNEDPEELRERAWPLGELIGFPSLRKLDLSHNFIGGGGGGSAADSGQGSVLSTLAFLPRLAELDVSANSLTRLPSPASMSHYWMLTKLVLRDNALGSGGGGRHKARRQQQREKEEQGEAPGTAGAKAGGGGSRRAHALTRNPLRTAPSAIASASFSDDEEDRAADRDEDAAYDDEEDPAWSRELASVPRALRKEYALFRSLASLPALVELDLSDNCIVGVPGGSITPLAEGQHTVAAASSAMQAAQQLGFPKLQFLNLSWNAIESEASVLALGDCLKLQWVDLRGNEFVTRAAREARPPRRQQAHAARHAPPSLAPTAAPLSLARHQHRSGPGTGATAVPTNWALALPDLYHVLVSNCRINVVLARPRYAAQGMQQDSSHVLRPPSSSPSALRGEAFAAEGNHLAAAGDIVATEARRERSRQSSAKQRAFGISQQQQQQQQRAHLTSSLESKEDHSAHARTLPPIAGASDHRPFGFSTAHEFEDATRGEGAQDALQTFLAQQQQQQLLLQHQQQQDSYRRSTAGAPAASATTSDPYADQYNAYSTTFLTGMSAEDLQATPAFTSSGLAAASAAAAYSHSHANSAQVQVQARRRGATQALTNMLLGSAVPVLKRLPAPRRSFGTPAARVSLFGVRQPKVAAVYSRMDAVLQSIEDRFVPGASMQTSTHTQQQAELAAMSSSAAGVRQPQRGAPSSAYVDPVHQRTTDKLRALRHLEKERNDVQALLRTVSEVSKQVLLPKQAQQQQHSQPHRY